MSYIYLIEIVGLLATITSCGTLLPQIIYTIKFKKATHISAYTCIIGLIASILWCMYAYLIGSKALLISQLLTLLTKIWMLKLKIKYTKKKKGESLWILFRLPKKQKKKLKNIV